MQNISLAKCFLPCWPFIPINQVNKAVVNAIQMTLYRLYSISVQAIGVKVPVLFSLPCCNVREKVSGRGCAE